MATKIIMPKLGFDMSSGKVVRWLKNIGDPVRKGEAVLEIETDKATVEVQADADGTLGSILVKEGDVPVGEAVGEIVGAGESARPARPAASPAKPATKDAPAVKSTPVTTEQPAEPQPVQHSANIQAPAAHMPAASTHIDASPLAKRMASELSINLSDVKGSGPGGRITKEDIEAYQAVPRKGTPAAAPAAAPAVAPAPAQPAAATRTGSTQLPGGEQPLTRMRQTIARRMAESKGPVPQFYLTTDVDIAAGMALVSQMNEAGKAEDLRVSPLSLVMKATATALHKFPNLNASFGGDRLILHDFVNLGVAVAVEGGLLTPVVVDCDKKSVAQLARDTRAVAERARAGKLSPGDLAQGTFSISNLGMFDIDHFVAIVNPPEAAILALGTAREVPVVEGGQIKPGWRMKLTLSADHRVTDGAEAARFLQDIKRQLQAPMSLLL